MAKKFYHLRFKTDTRAVIGKGKYSFNDNINSVLTGLNEMDGEIIDIKTQWLEEEKEEKILFDIFYKADKSM